MRTQVICTVPLALIALGARAGSLLGADLQYVHVEGLTWAFTVTTYVDPLAPADNPALFVSYDDINVDTIPRTSQTIIIGDCFMEIAQDVYAWQYTFPGPFGYPFKAWKSGRVDAVNLPTAPDNGLCLATTLIVDAELVNSSPVFSAPQRSSYYVGSTFVHDPGVIDPDGDSLTFSLGVPRGTDCEFMGAYVAPVMSTPNGDFVSFDPATGLFRWMDPNTSGVFTVVIDCAEWRDGAVIGWTRRDMTVCLQAPFTAIEEEGRDEVRISGSLQGPLMVQWNHHVIRAAHILDAHGAMIQHVRGSGSMITVPTDLIPAGLYFLKLTDGIGASASARFVVAR